MTNYIWKVHFRIDHLLTHHPVKGDYIEFFSPHFPSTENDKDYTEGQLTISLNNLNYSVKEIVSEGLRTVIALTNHINLPVEIINIESPPGVLPGAKLQASGYTSFPIKESERIPYLWNKYQKVVKNNHHELGYSRNVYDHQAILIESLFYHYCLVDTSQLYFIAICERIKFAIDYLNIDDDKEEPLSDPLFVGYFE